MTIHFPPWEYEAQMHMRYMKMHNFHIVGGTPSVKSEYIETVGLEGTFCDTVQVPSGVGDMQLI